MSKSSRIQGIKKRALRFDRYQHLSPLAIVLHDDIRYLLKYLETHKRPITNRESSLKLARKLVRQLSK